MGNKLLPVEWEHPRRQASVDIGGALISAVGTMSIIMSMLFSEAVTSSRLLPVLMTLNLARCLVCPRLFLSREIGLYFILTGYLFLSLLWTPDGVLGLNTLFPAADFVLTGLLFGSLFTFHNPRAVALGCLIGFWAGAAAYTYAVGFPLSYPEGFSYNATAAAYLVGLVVTLIFGWVTRMRAVTLASALLALAHVVATTSIKTNLGILLGIGAAAIVYRAEFVRIVRMNLWYFALAFVGIVYAIVSTDAIMAMVEGGFERVRLGLNVLQAREDVVGYAGFDEREYWMREGLRGWAHNPLFGHGVEAFRSTYGMTSHSTPVDLLYNTGAIGFCLFYGMFAVLAWRLLKGRQSTPRALQLLVLAGLVCQVFITLSGTVFYEPYIAVYVAASAALLKRFAAQVVTPRSGPDALPSRQAVRTKPPLVSARVER